MNELIDHEAVYRTAPAKPGLLNKTFGQKKFLCVQWAASKIH